MKKIAPRVIPDAARMMAKIIWKLQYGGYLQKFYYSRNGFRKFNDLMPHLEDLKYDEKRMEHLQSLHAVLKEYLAPEHFPNSTEFLGIYGRLCINSFNILDDDLNSVGTGIYLAASILDHSCKPNAVATFEGPQLSIRLIEDIPELKWDKIRISYIDQMDLPETRRAELKRSYYFDCDCERCVDATMTPQMLAMACPSDKDCSCAGKGTGWAVDRLSFWLMSCLLFRWQWRRLMWSVKNATLKSLMSTDRNLKTLSTWRSWRSRKCKMFDVSFDEVICRQALSSYSSLHRHWHLPKPW